jgi:hypothetical protein
MSAEAVMMPVQPLEQTEYVGHHRAAEEEAAQTDWRARLGQIAGRAALVLGLTAGGTAVIETAQPTEAHAEYRKTNGVCEGPFWGLGGQQTCVTGTMGEKNHWLQREFVRNVEVKSPDAGPGLLEIWGDGFYHSKKDATEWSWDIDKWVKTDTNICGAGTDKEGNRQIACFRISVE